MTHFTLALKPDSDNSQNMVSVAVPVVPRNFFNRRLVALSGILAQFFFWSVIFLPMYSAWQEGRLNTDVIFAQRGSLALFFCEILFIVSPLVLAGVSGITFFLSGRDNLHRYFHAVNLRYFYSRIGGFFVAAAVGFYYLGLRLPLVMTADAGRLLRSLANFMVSGGWIGVVAVAFLAQFHLPVQIWNFLLDNGLSVNIRTQKWLWRGLAFFGLAAALFNSFLLVELVRGFFPI